MIRPSYLFTSESVSEGHPDKVADRISDEVVDAFLAADPQARVACETMVTTNRIILAGEVRGPDDVIPGLEERVRAAVKAIGYEQDGFHWKTAKVDCLVHAQSADIAVGVDHGNCVSLGVRSFSPARYTNDGSCLRGATSPGATSCGTSNTRTRLSPARVSTNETAELVVPKSMPIRKRDDDMRYVFSRTEYSSFQRP